MNKHIVMDCCEQIQSTGRTGSLAQLWSRALGATHRLSERLQAARDRRATTRQLRALSDQQLQDIGIERHRIPAIAAAMAGRKATPETGSAHPVCADRIHRTA